MKNATIIGLLIIGIVLTSCRSAIPTNDSIAPTISFSVFPVEGTTGETISIPDDFDFDNDALYLKINENYIVMAIARDKANPVGGEDVKGSISRAMLTVPSDNLINVTNYPEDLPDNWTAGGGGGLGSATQTFSFIADPMNIKDGAVISPQMNPLALTRSGEYQFTFTAEDHHEHEKTKILIVRVTNDDAHIGEQ